MGENVYNGNTLEFGEIAEILGPLCLYSLLTSL